MLSSSPLMLFSLRVWCWYNGYSGTVGTEEEWDLWARWQGEILPAVAVKQSLMWTYPAERASWPERQPGWRLLSDLCHFKAGVLSFSVLHPFIPFLLYHSPHLLACSLPLCLSSSQPRFPRSGDNDIRTDGRFWDLFVRRSHNAHLSFLSLPRLVVFFLIHTHIKNLLFLSLAESSVDIYFVVLNITGIHTRCLVTRIWLFLKQHIKSPNVAVTKQKQLCGIKIN